VTAVAVILSTYLKSFTYYLIITRYFKYFAFRKVKILESTSVAVNAVLYMTCIIIHKTSHWGE